MQPLPRTLMSLIVILGVTLALVVLGQAWLWVRLRRLDLQRLLGRLESLQERQRALEQVVSARVGVSDSESTATMSRRSHPGPPSLRPQNPVHRVDPGESSAVSGPILIAVPSLTSPTHDNNSDADELGRRYGPIWELADRGATPDAIARSLGQPIGQVELILALRRQLASQAGEPRSQ